MSAGAVQEVYPGVRRGKREQAGRGAGEFLVYRRGKREEGRRVRVQGEVVGLIGCRGEERWQDAGCRRAQQADGLLGGK